MKKLSKLLNIIFVVILSSLLFACTEIIDKVTVSKIKIDSKYFEEEIYLEDFELSDYKLLVYLSDGNLKEVSIEESMISSEDLMKLSTVGNHTITVKYEGVETKFIITLIEKDNSEDEEDDKTEKLPLKLSILELNDTHGYIEQDESGKGGLSNTAFEINKIRNETKEDDVILIANGDMFQGTAISNTTYGLSVVDAMNKMGFDAMGIGNHEFDWGLDKITKYFDGDDSNGEANFPLLNANINERSTSKLLLNQNGKIFEYVIVEKEGIKVGIVSFIGDVSSSINYRFYEPYEILTNVEKLATNVCSTLKDNGADVIVVNVHGGNSSSVNSYDWNQIFANIRYNNEYVVDAIINGHTHTHQLGYIDRLNGLKVPVVQAYGNNGSIGRIDLTYDYKLEEVTAVNATHHYPSTAGYEESVEEVVKNYQEKVSSEVFSVAGETVTDRYDLLPWITNALRSASGADVAIINRAAIRSKGDIIKGNDVTINNLYEIIPFNNQIIIVELKGSEIYSFIKKSSISYSTDLNVNTLIADSKTYRVAVVDYVYYWDDFPQKDSAQAVNLYMTDILIEDVKLRDVFKPISDSKAYIGNLYD